MPRPRITRRRVLLASILGAVAAGGWWCHRLGRLAAEYRARAQSHADHTTLQAEIERALRESAAESARKALDGAERVAREAEFRRRLARTPTGPIDPGILGARASAMERDSGWDDRWAIDFPREMALADARAADRALAEAQLAARRAAHAASLRDKYERAAARPWLAVAPDPPEPR